MYMYMYTGQQQQQRLKPDQKASHKQRYDAPDTSVGEACLALPVQFLRVAVELKSLTVRFQAIMSVPGAVGCGRGTGERRTQQ